MKQIIQSVKGTRDFYPEQKAVQAWLYAKIAEVSREFGYQEWDGPILEKIDLYAAKSGEELVKQQAFVFPDKSGGLITLRPELTPSLARMVAQKQGELSYPLRWWSFGPFWRYEAPQKGRTREFFQWNIDLIGTTNPESDAELLAIAAAFFQKVGLKPDQVKIMTNNRRLMDATMAGLGIGPELRGQVIRLIDRQDKLRPAEWDAYALEIGLSAEQLAQLKDVLNDSELWQQSDELRRVFAVLEALGLRDYIQFDARVTRGLDYYTGTVFEARAIKGGRAILGGGRYDNLVAAVGGDPLPGVGFAMGDVMISIILEESGLIPALPPSPAQVLVTIFDETALIAAYKLAGEIRQSGLPVAVYPETGKLMKQLKYADKMGMKLAVILGPDEEAAGTVVIKDLAARSQEAVARGDLAAVLRQKLGC
jgi:histidyl-tRNA synthetase